MIAHVLGRLSPQVDEVLINANRSCNAYAQFGHRVIGDAIEGYAGPLAGLDAGLLAARNDFIVSVPCDAPFLPLDLVARMYQGLVAAHAEVAIAKTGARTHPVFCLAQRGAHRALRAYLAAGGRKAEGWYASLAVAQVDFGAEAPAFANINTLDELQHWEDHE